MSRKRRGHRAIAGAAAVTLVEAAFVVHRRGSLLAANTIVRCRRGHLFTTLWIPGGSLKAIRLGPWRLQHCPVGRHWTLVTPVRASELTPEQRDDASRRRDLRIP